MTDNPSQPDLSAADATEQAKPAPTNPKVPYNQRLALRAPAAAQMLSIGQRKLRAMKASGVIPYVKMEGCTAYRVEDLKRFVDENTIGGGK